MSKVSFSANRGGFEIGTPPGGQNFEGLGRVTLGVELVQNSIVTTGVIMSEPGKKNLSNLFSHLLKKKRFHVHFGLSSIYIYGAIARRICGNMRPHVTTV